MARASVETTRTSSTRSAEGVISHPLEWPSSYNWITPDQYNDTHSSLAGGFTYHGVRYTGDRAAVAEGDNFFSVVLPEIEASQAFKNNGLIVLWWDETEGGDSFAYTIPEIIISPAAKGNAYASRTYYTHASDLLTMEEIFQLGKYLGASRGDDSLAEMIQAPLLTALSGNCPNSRMPLSIFHLSGNNQRMQPQTQYVDQARCSQSVARKSPRRVRNLRRGKRRYGLATDKDWYTRRWLDGRAHTTWKHQP